MAEALVDLHDVSQQPERAEGSESGASVPAPERVRPHALAKLVRDDGTIDWSPWYLSEEEDMGQSAEQCRIINSLWSSLTVLGEERGWSSVVVAVDNFFAWVPDEPLVQVSPDIYLMDYPASESAEGTGGGSVASFSSLVPLMPDEPLPRRWETWRANHLPPRLAIEIVSQDWKKDYAINPARYDHLGVRELVLVDAEAYLYDLSKMGRAPLSVYRRDDSGRLELVYRGHGPAECVEIEAYLVFEVKLTGFACVRISRDEAGRDLVPTGWQRMVAAEEKAAAEQTKREAAEAKVTTAEAKVTAAETKVTAAEAKVTAERAKREAAEAKAAEQAAEIAALRARLRDLDPE